MNAFKKISVFFLHHSGINFICSFFLRDRLFILNYHSISDTKNCHAFSCDLYKNLSITAEQFERQVVFLKQHGHSFITFSDLDTVSACNLKKPTIIYFDDGFKDVLVNALSILQKYNIPATIFIPTGLADRTHFLWTLKYRHFLLHGGASAPDADKLISDLKNISDAEKDARLEEIYKKENFTFDPPAQDIFLNWDEIKKLSDNGWEVGSHGATHRRLTECNDADLLYEVSRSKTALENKLGAVVRSFSYPYGRSDNRVNDSLMKAGYRYIVSAGNGLNKKGILGKDINVLKSIGVKPGDNFYEFAVKLYTNNFLRKI